MCPRIYIQEYSIECVLFIYIVLSVFDYEVLQRITSNCKKLLFNLLYRCSKINMVRYTS